MHYCSATTDTPAGLQLGVSFFCSFLFTGLLSGVVTLGLFGRVSKRPLDQVFYRPDALSVAQPILSERLKTKAMAPIKKIAQFYPFLIHGFQASSVVDAL